MEAIKRLYHEKTEKVFSMLLECARGDEGEISMVARILQATGGKFEPQQEETVECDAGNRLAMWLSLCRVIENSLCPEQDARVIFESLLANSNNELRCQTLVEAVLARKDLRLSFLARHKEFFDNPCHLKAYADMPEEYAETEEEARAVVKALHATFSPTNQPEDVKFLVYAAQKDSPEKLKALIEQYKNLINKADYMDQTPLLAAVKLGLDRNVQIILERGGDPSVVTRTENAYVLAARKGFSSTLSVLLDHQPLDAQDLLTLKNVSTSRNIAAMIDARLAQNAINSAAFPNLKPL